jgi:iron complex outermembrane receptor protein
LGAEATLPLGFQWSMAWTRMQAKFLDTFASVANQPAVAVTVPAGSFLPGVPRSTFYTELRWRHAPSGFMAGLEFLRKSRVWVDDRNSEAADAYGVTNFAAGFTQLAGRWMFSEYFRVDNLTNRRYAGSVVVNDANLRFYEPAPGRNYTIGAQAKLGF